MFKFTKGIYTVNVSFNCKSCKCNLSSYFDSVSSCHTVFMPSCIIKSIKLCSCKINHSILSQCSKCICWYTYLLFVCHLNNKGQMVQRNMSPPPSYYCRIITITNRASTNLLRECIIFSTMNCVTSTLKMRKFCFCTCDLLT